MTTVRTLPDFPFPTEQTTSEWVFSTQLVILVIILSLITVITIFGNALVLIAFASTVSLRTPPNAYLASLAGVDFCIGLFVLPFEILLHAGQGKWVLGQLFCKVWLTAEATLCSLSVFHLIAIAVDRHRAMSEGISYVQRRSFHYVISVVSSLWLFSLWIGSSPALGWNDWDENDIEVCRFTESFVSHSAIGCFIVPMVVMAVLYWKIYKAIQERLRERARVPAAERSVDEETCSDDGYNSLNLETERKQQKLRSSYQVLGSSRERPISQMQEFVQRKIKSCLSKERKAAKNLGIIVGAMIFCWTPYALLMGVSVYLPQSWKPSDAVYQSVTWLGYVNSGVNPIIYTMTNKEFKKSFKQILHLT